MRHLAAAVAAVALLIACSGSAPKQDDTAGTTREFVSAETSACIDQHPPGEPFDLGDVSAEMSGGGAPSVESLAAECRAGNGTGCDGELISLEAARCIAQNERFEPGLDPWTLGLTYHHSYHRLVWGIENLLVDNGAADYSGQSLTVDALTGRVLGRTGWSAMQ